jgi:hypothetical protein
LLSHEKEQYIDKKSHENLKITGLVNNKFKPNQVQKSTQRKLCNTLALLSLNFRKLSLCGRLWRDHKTNEEILNKLKVTLILDKITSYKTE